MVVTTWDGLRRPLDDDGADDVRKGRYWAWSETTAPTDEVSPFAVLDDDVTLHSVATHEQADFEARHMQHSVGYNFDHYSDIGDIVSLRQDGVPFVTALVSGGVIVHAVRACNEIVTDDDRAILQVVCDRYGWSMPDNETLQGRRADDEDARPDPN